MSHVSYVNEFVPLNEETSRWDWLRMSHVSYEWVMSHMWMNWSHSTRRWVVGTKCEWVMSRIWISRVLYLNELVSTQYEEESLGRNTTWNSRSGNYLNPNLLLCMLYGVIYGAWPILIHTRQSTFTNNNRRAEWLFPLRCIESCLHTHSDRSCLLYINRQLIVVTNISIRMNTRQWSLIFIFIVMGHVPCIWGGFG